MGAASVYLGHGFMCTLQTLRAAEQGLLGHRDVFLSDSVNVNKSLRLMRYQAGRQAGMEVGTVGRQVGTAGRHGGRVCGQARRLGLQAGMEVGIAGR